MIDVKKPKPCHYDRTLAMRVTRDHRDDCPDQLGTGPCPAGGRGCAPCTAPHCGVCGREHATNAHPATCPECIGRVRDDLTDIQSSYTALEVEAMDAGGDGRLVAAAPIPGGTAQVLIGPTVRLPLLRVGRKTSEDHRPGDPIPPLAILAQWEDIYRAWLGHEPRRTPVTAQAWLGAPVDQRSIAGAIGYLTRQLDYLANHLDPNADGVPAPDWVAFTRQVRNIRAQLEHALHDEQEPERGVECFECGDRLVRRFRDPKRCRHSTPARAWFREGLRLGSLGYPELQPQPAEVRAARQPCGRCSQGGIDDPESGQSWECPGCRKEYDVGEYVSAVRRVLVEDGGGAGWCTFAAAAENAQEITGRTVTAKVVRTWVERDGLAVRCPWRKGQRFGLLEVFWPDVLERANQRRRPGPKTRAS